ncbi:EF-hand calcium-binding domain-containing protein 6-like [Polymixia lowei]
MPVNGVQKLQYREFLKRFGTRERTAHAGSGIPAVATALLPAPEPKEIVSLVKSGRPKTAGAILQRSERASHAPSGMGSQGTGNAAGSAERRLRGEVQRCWREIQGTCAEEDPRREGEISAISFLDVLQSLNISVTREELERLSGKYDITNNGRVSYHNFLGHFLLNLKPPAVQRTFERRRLPPPTTGAGDGVLSRQCVGVMLRICEAVRLSWSAIRHSFMTFDRSRTGSISVQEFRKVLRRFSVNLSEEEFFQLSSSFDASAAGRICYNDFLRAFLY